MFCIWIEGDLEAGDNVGIGAHKIDLKVRFLLIISPSNITRKMNYASLSIKQIKMNCV